MAYWPLWQASFGGLHATNASIRIIDATELVGLIGTKELSPVEIVQADLDRIEAVYPQVNAIVTLLAADALKAAKAAETAAVSGDELGAFQGAFRSASRTCSTLRGFNGATSSRTWKLPFRKSLGLKAMESRLRAAYRSPRNSASTDGTFHCKCFIPSMRAVAEIISPRYRSQTVRLSKNRRRIRQLGFFYHKLTPHNTGNQNACKESQVP